jgi:DNA-binding CsgD family transcriptional regulator
VTGGDDRTPRPPGPVDGPVGRDSEVAALVAAFTEVDPATVTVALVVGEPGMGKTSIVRHALARSGAFGVVADADPAESDLEYGVLEQLVRRSPLDGSAAADLVPLAGTDPLVAGAALLRFVDGLALDRPLVVVVDDVHWADRASLDAMTFAARRVQGDQVVLCLTCRPEGLDRVPAGLARLVVPAQRRIDLGPLDSAAVAELASRSTGGPFPAAASERLRAHTGGNPLHIGALLRELAPGELLGGGRLPAPRSYRALVLGRLAACRPPAQRLVEALAVLDRRPAVTTAMAVAGLDPAGDDDGVAALDEAMETGFVELVERPGERSLVFTHPLVAAAVSGDMSPSRRAELHRAAGAVVPGVAGLRHRLDGTAGHDVRLAADACAGARAEAERGAYASAARLWAGAARVAPDPANREQARLQSVDHHLLAGDLAAAARDRPLVDDATDGPLRSFVLGRLAYVLGPRGEAEGHLDRAWLQVDVVGDRALAGRIAALRATTAVDRGDGAAGLVWARRALSLARVAAADCNHGHMLAMSCALEGQMAAGIAELTAALEPPPPGPAAVADLRLGRGVLLMWAHDLPGAAADLVACLGSSGAGGTFVARETARYFLAELYWRAGRWDDAVVTAETAAAIVDETDQVWLAAFPHAVAVYALAARGEVERAAAHLAAARAAGAEARGGAARLWAGVAAVRLAESQFDAEAVVAAGDRLDRAGGQATAGVRRLDEAIAPWRAGYAETLAAVGRLDDARLVTAWLDDQAATRASPLVAADAARAGIAVALAEGDVAAATVRAGELDPVVEDAGPFPLGRLGLVAGRAWLAAGERERAVAAFAAARRRFSGLGAAPWVAAAERELAAAGARATVSRVPTGAVLTPREQAVAHVVARGATNREAAAELFLSVKTVEHHLSRAYTKLGVRSRTELARTLRAEERAAGHPL